MLDDKEAVLAVLEKRLNPQHMAKKLRGEVFTPMPIVERLLDRLPSDIWKNPCLKWLDPASGIGNFPIAVYYRLMEGLSSTMPDMAGRKRHILENMIYACEIDRANCEVYKSICGAEYLLNLVHGDFLAQDFRNMNFDVVTGNPPYHCPSPTGRSNGQVLYPKFVKKSLELLKTEGFLCMITPPGWRKPVGKRSPYASMFQILTGDCQMKFLEVHDAQDGLRYLKAGTRYDLYVCQKTPCKTETVIVDINGAPWALDLRQWPWFPNTDFDFVRSLISDFAIESKVLKGLHLKNTSELETHEFSHAVIMGIDTRGAKVRFSSETRHMGAPKVILGDSGTGFLQDVGGCYSLGNHAFGLPIKSHGDSELLINFLKSPIFRQLRNACSWSTFRLDWGLFTFLKDDFWILSNVHLPKV